ncbi:MAG: nucleotidyltransferase family protein [Candidatus Riflebacteria bacterium]|nr:nucleotidyltransferase family protein [Candidatus Riflebacteria bacterium]
MRPSEALNFHRENIRRIFAENNTLNPRIFGSVIHGIDNDDSDLDILVDPTPETTLLDIARIQSRLQQILGVSVDVLTPKALPEKFRESVLKEAIQL